MNFLDLIKIEVNKIKRTKILWIILIPIILLWAPAIINADMNLRQIGSLNPSQNFLFQSLSSYTCFLFPATIVIVIVMMTQIENKNKGLLKMLSLPIDKAKLCLAKFVVLLTLIFIQVFMGFITYFISVTIASNTVDYNFLMPLGEVIKLFSLVFVTAIPMMTVYWLLATVIKTPIFSVGIGMVSIVPSVLIMNTSKWFIYPVDYPFMMISSMLPDFGFKLIPWLPVAVAISIFCLGISCLLFGNSERR